MNLYAFESNCPGKDRMKDTIKGATGVCVNKEIRIDKEEIIDSRRMEGLPTGGCTE